MKKVLIITYYWPPSGGAGVQRWLKFTKYLRNFGWEPVIYTPENPETPEEDNSLLRDIPANITILKQPIWEPYDIYKKIIGQKKEQKINSAFLSETKKPKFTEQISVWIRGNFFIPDARVFWITPSVKFLSDFLKQNPVDAIVSTGPPHSMHLIAMQLQKKLKLPWLADFRDPWTNIDFYKDLKLTWPADKKHHKLELKVLKNATAVVTIGKTIADDFAKIYNRSYEVITNGYDNDDVAISNVVPDKKFSIAHIGTLVKTRNPIVLWSALKDLMQNKEFAGALEIKLVGKVDYSVNKSIEEFELSEFVNRIDYMPHSEVIKFQQESQVLLLLINDTPNAKSILTGKFFEYLSAKRPILCIGTTEGDAAKILRETNSGLISDFNDVETLKKNILEYFEKYKNNRLVCESSEIEKYSRLELTKNMAGVLNGIV
ncbi:MAG: glycosyltransferase family 4 protein [Bacteroidales bacterium]|nr:glycosyltransferase family 4 protein [Bacteroidales bacterium]